MGRLEELEQKYAPVLKTVQQQGVRLSHLHVQDNKLYIQGAAPSESIKNAVWNQIKAINPVCDDISADLKVDTSLPQPAQTVGLKRTYTVKAGDSLSKIAQRFYGNGNDYMRIFEANRDRLTNPDKVEIGQQLVIPADR